MGSEEDSQFSTLEQVPLLMLISVMIILAVCGNIALLFAMYAQPKLRTTSNPFIGRSVTAAFREVIRFTIKI